jgi:hypothetical protein
MKPMLATGLLLLAALLPRPAVAGETIAPKETPDCAKELPADASDESIRINCEIPLKYRQDAMMAEVIGSMIRMHDAAAWLTTDAVVEIGALKDFGGAGRGWLTLENGDRIDVRYFSESDGQIRAFASASLDTKAMKAVDARKLSPPEAMTDREQRLMGAKSLVLSRDDYFVCTKHPPNTVVTEFEEDGVPEILVFVMSAWADEDMAPLGGYHMYRVSQDGKDVIDHFSQTKSCPMATGKELQESESLMVSHINSATPTMFHVFMSLQYRKPIYVSTTQNGLLWKVDRARIELLKTPEKDGAPASPRIDAGDGEDGAARQ